jgi:hypothetical protein
MIEGVKGPKACRPCDRRIGQDDRWVGSWRNPRESARYTAVARIAVGPEKADLRALLDLLWRTATPTLKFGIIQENANALPKIFDKTIPLQFSKWNYFPGIYTR